MIKNGAARMIQKAISCMGENVSPRKSQPMIR